MITRKDLNAIWSGQGCDDISRIQDMHGYSFGDFFESCEKRYGNQFHLTRLDVAIDDRNEVPFFTSEQIKRKCEREEFIANSNSYRFVESSFSEKETAKPFISGLGNRICPIASMTRIKKSV